MKTIICCSHAGGQGKTTVSQLIYLAAKKASAPMGIIAADFVDETGHSKIGRMYPGQVKELGTGPDVVLARVQNDLNASLKYWDQLGPSLLKGGDVFDMGANVIDQVLDWGRARHASELLTKRSAPAIEIVLVCRAEKRAIDDLGDLVKRFGSKESLPVNRITVVQNEYAGDFASLDLKGKLSQIKIGCDLEFVTMPRCTSELWNAMEANYVGIEEALSFSPEEAVEKLGVDMWSSYSGVDDLKNWFDDMVKSFRAVKLV